MLFSQTMAPRKLLLLIVAAGCTFATAVAEAMKGGVAPAQPSDIRHPQPQLNPEGLYDRPYAQAEGCRDDEDWVGTFCLDYRVRHRFKYVQAERLSAAYWVSCRPRRKHDVALPNEVGGKIRRVNRHSRQAVRRFRSACPTDFLCRPHLPQATLLAAAAAGIDSTDSGAVLSWARWHSYHSAATGKKVRMPNKAYRVQDTTTEVMPRIDCVPQFNRRVSQASRSPDRPAQTSAAPAIEVEVPTTRGESSHSAGAVFSPIMPASEDASDPIVSDRGADPDLPDLGAEPFGDLSTDDLAAWFPDWQTGP